MSRAGAGALVALAFAAGLALRIARLDARPMHHDEANQAVKFGALLEGGAYRYDAHDHHGPTLYYLALPAAWLRGQHTLAALDERTLRGVTAVFGAATILLLLPLIPAVGRTAAAAAAWLLALSPAMVFYSRMFIQEAMFACFTLAFIVAAGRAAIRGGLAWPAVAGVAAGLAVATKETAVIVLPAALIAGAAAWWSLGSARPPIALHQQGRWRTAALLSAAAAAGVAGLFFSSFLAAPAAVLEPLRAAGTYLQRGVDPANHAHPWHYYVGLLAYSSSGGLRWSEGLVLGLALAGAIAGWRQRADRRAETTWWARTFALYVLLAGGIFSAIRYKTPWNLLPFYLGAIVLAGFGAAAVLRHAPGRALRGLLGAALVAGTAHLGWQAWRASVVYASDPRNPYVYAQTVPDAVRMGARIRNLAALHEDGAAMQVSVIAPPHEQWPLPWYLRTMPNVGYWPEPGDPMAVQAPVIVASLANVPLLDAALGDRYVSEYYGLRPDVLIALYIERGLWDRFLARVARTSVGGSPRPVANAKRAASRGAAPARSPAES
jgi:uncharacterized protein (TIGR03663 family)